MNEKIIAGLKQLDVKTDAQWTQEGLVNLNAFKFVLGGESVTREQVEEAAPGFTRENAATYFDEEKKKEATVSVDSALTVSEGESGIVDTEQASGPDDKLLFVIKLLRGDFPVLVELSDEELARYKTEAETVRDYIHSARDEFNELITSGLHYLNDLSGEVIKRKPVETLADQVKRMHEANVGQNFEIDKGRQRTIQPFPPLRK